MTCPVCGHEFKSHARSVEQHRRFFALLRAMYRHWPESSEFQPESEEHLRKWVLIKAGYREITEIPVEFADRETTRLLSFAIESAIRASGSYAFVRPDLNGGRVAVFRAKSIAFGKMGQAEFNRLNDAVEEVLRAETGLEPDAVLREEERAA